MLEEVVVVPYGGPVARKDLTGSVVSVNVEDMKALQAVTFEMLLPARSPVYRSMSGMDSLEVFRTF